MAFLTSRAPTGRRLTVRASASASNAAEARAWISAWRAKSGGGAAVPPAKPVAPTKPTAPSKPAASAGGKAGKAEVLPDGTLLFKF